MKHIRLAILLIFLLLPTGFLLPASYGQTGGWAWGAGSTGGGVDAYAVTTDGSGNAYGAGVNYSGGTGVMANATFGTINVPNTAVAGTTGGLGYIQAIWAKYNSTGTVLWADGTQNGDAWLYNITTDPSGNFIVFGSFDSPTLTIGATTLTNAYGTSGDNQYFLAKYSPAGTLLWAVCDGNSVNTDLVFLGSVCILSAGGVSTDAAGNIYITSSFQKPSITIGGNTLTNADPSGTTFDIFVAKYTPAGAVVWAKRAGGSSDDFAFGITAVPSGNVYVTGPFWSPSVTFGSSVITDPYGGGGYGGGFGGGTPLAYIAEFSSTGTATWGEAAGGNSGAYGMGLVSDASGNVYLTGGFGDVSLSFGSVTINRTYPGAAPNLALYLVQFSPANIVTWSKTIGSPTFGLWGFAIGLAACGEVWVSGNYSENANIDGNTLALVTGSDPIFMAGYNMAGGVIGYAGLGSGGDDQNGIAVDPNGNVFICSDYQDNVPFSIGHDVISTGTGLGDELFYLGKYTNIVGVADTNFTHSDTTLCNAAGVTLSAPPGYSGYLWNNASTLATLGISTSGTYWVMCTSTCSVPVLIDTFHVNISTAGTTYNSSNMAICGGAVVNINGDPGYISYTWSNGSNTSSIAVSDTGVFWVTEISGCGTRTDTFHISLVPPMIVTATSTPRNCNSTLSFDCTPAGPGYSYLWSGPAGFSSVIQDPYITNLVPADQGIYSVSVVDNSDGCSGQATVAVTVGPGTTLHLTNVSLTQIINYGSSVQLNADNATYYWWMPNDGTISNRNINDPIVSPRQNTTYTVYGIDSIGCMDSAKIIVDVIFDSIAIPSAFTPNGDGLNDIFRPAGMKYQKLIEFSVYNRWGQQVFTTNNKERGWDGTFNGVPQDLGVFDYVIIVELDDGTTHFYKGDVTLIR